MKPAWPERLRNRQGWYLALLSGAVILLVLLATVPDYGYHYDEPIYELATQKIVQWLKLPGGERFSPAWIDRQWKTFPSYNVHPAGLKWLNVLAHATLGGIVPDVLYQDRVVIVLFFTLSLLFFLRSLYPEKPHYLVLVPLLLLSQPRFFAQAHFAVTEMPMLATILLIWGVWRRVFHTRYFWLLGPLLGFFWSIKLTCWILSAVLVVLLVWSGEVPFRKSLLRLGIVLAGGILMFYLLNPDYWYHPWGRLLEFLHQSLTRSQWTPISTMYFGHVYLERGPLLYSFVVFGITTPLLHLGLLLAGLGLSPWWRRPGWKRELPLVAMAFFMFFFLMLPLSPAHDNERYLLPGYPFLAVIMAWGAERLVQLCRRPAGRWRRRALTAALGVLLLIGLAEVGCAFRVYHPHELSYFNELVGGVRGAEKRGFEVTYLFDVMSPALIDRLNATCAGRGVYFVFPYQSLLMVMLQEEGRLWFRPTLSAEGVHFVAVYGRPNMGFWETKLRSSIPRGLNLQLCWQETVDGVPIFRLYRICPARAKGE